MVFRGLTRGYQEACQLASHIGYSAFALLLLCSIFVLLTIVSFLMYLFVPYRLLALNEMLQGTAIGTPDSWLQVRAPLKYVLGVGLFHRSDRLLDAFVRKYAATARKRFAEMESVRERRIHVDLPVQLAEQALERLEAAHLVSHFSRASCCLLITGEGGSGKTSLACRIAGWALSAKKGERIARHTMLPVLIEYPLAQRASNPLQRAISAAVKDLTGAEDELSQQLLRRLLARKRILVIVDRLSEMDERTRDSIRPEIAELGINALIVTSRLNEDLRGLRRVVLSPRPIPNDQLYVFLDSYLRQAGVPCDHIRDQFIDACSQLTVAVGRRETTPLLAKLFVAHLISCRREEASWKPTDVPHLIRSHIDRLNEKVQGVHAENAHVQRCCEALAWECIRGEFKPVSIDWPTAVRALLRAGGIEADIGHLGKGLKIIRYEKEGHPVRFASDPVAEYLAAMHFTAACMSDPSGFVELLQEARRKPGSPQSVSGFLMALRDCCLAGDTGDGTLRHVADELGEVVGLSARAVEETRQAQNLRLFIRQLAVGTDATRLEAIKGLAALGPLASPAVLPLANALKDKSPAICEAAASALGKIGPAAASAVPQLVGALRGKQWRVPLAAAAEALASIGPAASEAVPVLISLFETAKCRYVDGIACLAVAKALARISPEGVRYLIGISHTSESLWPYAIDGISEAGLVALPQLIELLKDSRPPLCHSFGNMDSYVNERLYEASIKALAKIGPAASAAVPQLLEDLQSMNAWGGPYGLINLLCRALGEIDPTNPQVVCALVDVLWKIPPLVTWAAVETLGKIGAIAVPELIDALQKQDSYIWVAVPEALGEIGPPAINAVPHLEKLLLNEDVNVRRAATAAIKKICGVKEMP